ncbi:MAG: hypothetical protein AB1758_15615 [Candidatus Eremiobacterota bacterium]
MEIQLFDVPQLPIYAWYPTLPPRVEPPSGTADALAGMGLATTMWSQAAWAWAGLPDYEALSAFLNPGEIELLLDRLFRSGLLARPEVLARVMSMLAGGANLKEVMHFLDQAAPAPQGRFGPPTDHTVPLPVSAPAAGNAAVAPAAVTSPSSPPYAPASGPPTEGPLPSGHADLERLKGEVTTALAAREGALASAQAALETARNDAVQRLGQGLGADQQRRLNEENQRYNQARTQRDQLKVRQREKTTRRNELEGRKRVEQERKREADREVTSAQGRVSMLRAELGTPPDPGVQSLLEAALEELDQARERQRQAREALNAIQLQLDSVNQELQELEEDLREAEETMREAMAEMDRIRGVEPGQTQQELDSDPQVQAAQTEVDQLEAEVSALHSRLQEIEAALADGEAQRVRDGDDPGRMPPELTPETMGGPASSLTEGVNGQDGYNCLEASIVYAEANAGQQVLLLQDTNLDDEELEQATGTATHHTVVLDAQGRVVFDGTRRIIPPQDLDSYLEQTGYSRFEGVDAVDPADLRDTRQAAALSQRITPAGQDAPVFADPPAEDVYTGPLAYDEEVAAHATALLEAHQPDASGRYTVIMDGRLYWADSVESGDWIEVTADELRVMRDAGRMAVPRPEGEDGDDFDDYFEAAAFYSDFDADDPNERIYEQWVARDRLRITGIQAFAQFNDDLTAIESYSMDLNWAQDQIEAGQDDFQETTSTFARFMAEHGPYLSGDELNAAQAAFEETGEYREAYEELCQDAERYRDLLHNPMFQIMVFENMDAEEQMEVFDTVTQIANTPAGAELADEIFNGLTSDTPNTYARALEALVAREADWLVQLGDERPETDGVYRATVVAAQIAALATSRQDPQAVVRFLESRMGRLLFGDTNEAAELFRQLVEAREAGPRQYLAARGTLRARIEDSLNSGGLFYVAGGVLAGLLAVQDLGIMRDRVMTGEWGDDIIADGKLLADLGFDGGGAAAVGLRIFGTTFRSQVALNAVSWMEHRALPVLGAVSSFLSAFMWAEAGHAIPAIADTVSGIGFLVMMVPGGQVAGLIISAVGALVSLGYHLLHENEEEEEYQELVRHLLEHALPEGDPRLSILPGLDRERLEEVARQGCVTLQEAWAQLYQQYLAMGAPGDFNLLLEHASYVPGYGLSFFGAEAAAWAERSGISVAEAWQQLLTNAQGWRAANAPDASLAATLEFLAGPVQDRLFQLADLSGRPLAEVWYQLQQMYAGVRTEVGDRFTDFQQFLTQVEWRGGMFVLNGPILYQPDDLRPPTPPGG